MKRRRGEAEEEERTVRSFITPEYQTNNPCLLGCLVMKGLFHLPFPNAYLSPPASSAFDPPYPEEGKGGEGRGEERRRRVWRRKGEGERREGERRAEEGRGDRRGEERRRGGRKTNTTK